MEKETGKEFAAKIIDLGAAESGDSNHMLEATKQEIQILRQVMGHKFISEYILTWLQDFVSTAHPQAIRCQRVADEIADLLCVTHASQPIGWILSLTRMVLFSFWTVELQDVFESDAFIFLVFELCRQGELFDYLTSVVTLSEKKSRYIMR